MDQYLEQYVERVMEQQEVTNSIKILSWLSIFKR